MRPLLDGLRATRERMRLGASAASDEAPAFGELEEALLLGDCGTTATKEIIAKVRDRIGSRFDLAAFGAAIREEIGAILAPMQRPEPAWEQSPHVVLLVGTNGGGKTTTAAKLARSAVGAGHRVILGAADTFRAAAEDQLRVHAERLGEGVQVVSSGEPGAAAYNAVSAARETGAALAIIDTAGRQPTSKALMAEAKKIRGAIAKAMPGAPHETLLAIDANTGQNALRQVEAFEEAIGLTGLVLTKLDSTARGGVILAIGAKHDLPLRFVGVGEGLDALLEFDAQAFAAALLGAEG